MKSTFLKLFTLILFASFISSCDNNSSEVTPVEQVNLRIDRIEINNRDQANYIYNNNGKISSITRIMAGDQWSNISFEYDGDNVLVEDNNIQIVLTYQNRNLVRIAQSGLANDVTKTMEVTYELGKVSAAEMVTISPNSPPENRELVHTYQFLTDEFGNIVKFDRSDEYSEITTYSYEYFNPFKNSGVSYAGDPFFGTIYGIDPIDILMLQTPHMPHSNTILGRNQVSTYLVEGSVDGLPAAYSWANSASDVERDVEFRYEIPNVR